MDALMGYWTLRYWLLDMGRRRGRIRRWCYAPGYVDDRAGNCAQLSGTSRHSAPHNVLLRQSLPDETYRCHSPRSSLSIDDTYQLFVPCSEQSLRCCIARTTDAPGTTNRAGRSVWATYRMCADSPLPAEAENGNRHPTSAETDYAAAPTAAHRRAGAAGSKRIRARD